MSFSTDFPELSTSLKTAGMDLSQVRMIRQPNISGSDTAAGSNMAFEFVGLLADAIEGRYPRRGTRIRAGRKTYVLEDVQWVQQESALARFNFSFRPPRRGEGAEDEDYETPEDVTDVTSSHREEDYTVIVTVQNPNTGGNTGNPVQFYKIPWNYRRTILVRSVTIWLAREAVGTIGSFWTVNAPGFGRYSGTLRDIQNRAHPSGRGFVSTFVLENTVFSYPIGPVPQ